MKERPILFSGPMVRAILEGRKTQTRRVAKNPEACIAAWNSMDLCPYGIPGDRLWVRETHDVIDRGTEEGGWTTTIVYRADGAERTLAESHPRAPKRIPAIHMRREYSRITLEIVEVRCQYVQEITEEDAIAEGIERDRDGWKGCRVILEGPHKGKPHSWNILPNRLARDSFSELWDSINHARGFGWEANPLVWAISFKVLTAR